MKLKQWHAHHFTPAVHLCSSFHCLPSTKELGLLAKSLSCVDVWVKKKNQRVYFERSSEKIRSHRLCLKRLFLPCHLEPKIGFSPLHPWYERVIWLSPWPNHVSVLLQGTCAHPRFRGFSLKQAHVIWLPPHCPLHVSCWCLWSNIIIMTVQWFASFSLNGKLWMPELLRPLVFLSASCDTEWALSTFACSSLARYKPTKEEAIYYSILYSVLSAAYVVHEHLTVITMKQLGFDLGTTDAIKHR